MNNGGYQPKASGAPTSPPPNFRTAGIKKPTARDGDLKIFFNGEWHMVMGTKQEKWVLAIKNPDEPVPVGQNALPLTFTTRLDAENAAKLRCDVVEVQVL